MKATAKVTKKNILTAIATLIDENVAIDVDGVTVTGEDIADYISTTINQLDAKAAKAKERAAKNKAEGDEAREAVAAVLTEKLQTADDITAMVDFPEVTKSKVVARLGQLVKAGVARKELVKAEDGRKLMAYAKISE